MIPLRSQHANIATVLTAQRDQAISGCEMENICPDFIVSSFKEACQNNEFHHRWMTADTWAKLIVKYYKLSNDVAYNGKQLVRALALRKYSYLNNQIQADPQNVPKDHIGIFRFQYRPKGKPILYCFYATPKGGIPITKENAWYNYISDGEDLLNKDRASPPVRCI